MKQESRRQSLPSNHRRDGPLRNARIQQLAKECKSRNPPLLRSPQCNTAFLARSSALACLDPKSPRIALRATISS
jgi:hypothetical protein